MSGSIESKLTLDLGVKECFARKNDWVRNELGDAQFTGAFLAKNLMTACSAYRTKESNPETTGIQLLEQKDRILTAMSVWWAWRVMHKVGKSPANSMLPMEVVDAMFLKVNDEIESQFNIVFEIHE